MNFRKSGLYGWRTSGSQEDTGGVLPEVRRIHVEVFRKSGRYIWPTSLSAGGIWRIQVDGLQELRMIQMDAISMSGRYMWRTL